MPLEGLASDYRLDRDAVGLVSGAVGCIPYWASENALFIHIFALIWVV